MFEFLIKFLYFYRLAKKAELTRMSNLITNKIHLISHLRCRRKLMSRKHRVAKIELLNLQKEFAVLRQKVHKGNLMRNKIFAQINECRRQGGIIHFPLLMKDYDDTLIYLEEKREVIKNLRRRRRKIERKINNVECSIHILDSRSTIQLWG